MTVASGWSNPSANWSYKRANVSRQKGSRSLCGRDISANLDLKVYFAGDGNTYRPMYNIRNLNVTPTQSPLRGSLALN